MLSVLHIAGTDPRHDGGVNNVIKNLCTGLAQSIHSKIFNIYAYGDEGYLKNVPKLVKKFDLILGPLLLKKKLKGLLAKNKIDIIHVHGADAAYDVAVNIPWLHKQGIKCIYRLPGIDRDILTSLLKEIAAGNIKLTPLHLFHLAYFTLSALKERFSYPRFDYCTAVSSGVKNKFEKIYGLYAHLTPNGFARTEEPAELIYTREKLSIPKTSKVILFVGVSSWTKGFHYFNKLMSANPHYVYMIVGIKVEPRKNIINLPYIEHKYISQIYKLADALVHTAINEPFGLIYVEALHYGIPVVSFRTDGAEDLINNGENGFLVDKGDLKGLANCLTRLFGDEKLYKKVVLNGKKTARKYTFQHTVINNYLEYQKLVHQKTILCIPHLIKKNINSRTELIAQALLRQGHKVYLLSWQERKETSYGPTLTNIKYLLRELFRLPHIKIENGIRKVYLPRLVYPLRTATWFNTLFINYFIKKNNIEKVINASFLYYQIDAKQCEYIYDYVDDHVLYTKLNQRPGATGVAKQMEKYIAREARKAEKLLFVNQALYNKFKLPNKKCIIVNNGAFFSEYQNPDLKLRHKLGLDNKFIYGMIGNHGEWSGIREVIEIFKKNAAILKNSVLLIVGPVYNPRLLDNLPKNIKYIGSVLPSEVKKYYALCDSGIQAAEDSEFRKMTFPLKIIEYTAAKKIVLAFSAKNLKELDLPNLIISPRDKKSIVKNLLLCQKLEWQEKWHKITEKYEWQALIKKL